MTASELCQFFESHDNNDTDPYIIARNVAIILNKHRREIENLDENQLIDLYDSLGNKFEVLAAQARAFEDKSLQLAGEATMLSNIVNKHDPSTLNYDAMRQEYDDLSARRDDISKRLISEQNEIIDMIF